MNRGTQRLTNKTIMPNTRLIFTGGFLGAGKTTLLYEVTRRLTTRGLKVGLITNNQAPDLADTSLLKHASINVAEVSGSCFCCDFKSLRKAIEKVGNQHTTDIIIAEPVGSCTDLSATLINPMKEIMKSEITPGPLTVLVDPARLKDVLDGNPGNLHPSVAYIIKKQMEESDVIAITKSDQYGREEIESLSEQLKRSFSECRIMVLSSKSGEGIDEWLEYVLSDNETGKHLLEIDYDRYAEGEAVLGWLNCSASLSGTNVDWDAFTNTLMQSLAAYFDTQKFTVGHLKMMIENGDQYVSANLTGHAGTLAMRWSAGTGNTAEMIVNARIEMPPQELEKVFRSALDEVAGSQIKVKINRIRSISPGYPKPTYRESK